MKTTASQVSLVSNASTTTGQLPIQDWISTKATRTVIAALEAKGTSVRFIGGCVRDAIAHRPVTDIDIATPDRPETVMALLEADGINAIPTGLKHGTVTAIIDKAHFEITTLRRDLETDGRHATVEFTDDWLEDAKRRDFTINAMSASPDGAVFDPFNGISDLAHGRVRFIGIARDRVEEDYLRILRFFRFYGLFGHGAMDQNAKAACRAGAKKLQTISKERIRDELLKILLVANPAEICVHMRRDKVLDQVLPEASDINHLRIVNWLETRALNVDKVEPDAIRHLAAILNTDRAGVDRVADQLKLSNAQRKRLVALSAPDEKINANMGDAGEQRAIRRLGGGRVRDLALLAWAKELTGTTRLPRQRTEAYIRLLERCAAWVPPDFPISGTDVLTLGLRPGPMVGTILGRVEAWWENTGYEASRQECLDRLIRVARETEGDHR